MNDKKQHIDEKDLLKLLLGEATQQEIVVINQWLDASEEHRLLLDKVETIWLESAKLKPTPVPVDVKAAWQKTNAKMEVFEKAKNKPKILPFKPLIAAIAASVILAFGIFQLINNQTNTSRPVELASNQNIIQQDLPDGSQIALNINTKITYPKRFQNKQRVVELNGEAFFNVERNPKKPFIIKTADAQIQVLGTSFNVNAHANKNLTVDVASGTVKVFTVSEQHDTMAVIINAGNRAILKMGQNEPEFVEKGNADAFFWNNKTLVFNEMSLNKVIMVLESHYDVRINLSNPNVGECLYSGKFSNTSIQNIVSLIATSFNFELKTDLNTYTLVGNGCFQN